MEATGISMCCLICGDTNLLSNCSEEQDNISVYSLNKFAQQLGLQQVQGVSFTSLSEIVMCDDCKSGVVKSTELRDQVADVERDVRSLQRIILKMMRQLTSLQGNYLTEMRTLDRKTRKSDENGKGGGKKINELSWSCAKALRQGIHAVVVELGVFEDGLSDHVAAPLSAEPNVSAAQQDEIRGATHEAPEPELPLSEDLIKEELNSFDFEAHSDENGMQDQEDPLSTETDNPIDIETVIYSQDPVKKDPLSPEETDNDAQLSTPVTLATASTSTSSRLKPLKKKRKTLPATGFCHGRGPCPYCGKTFAKLKRHIMFVHTRERPHKCDICHMAFTVKCNLTRHQLTHNGKKPFTCPECGKGFSIKAYMDSHRKRKHLCQKPST